MQNTKAGLTFRSIAPWPYFAPDEIEAVERVLRSGKVNYWTGEEGRRFEQEFAEKIGCQHAVAVANGSVGLELALHALGIGPGDEVIVTPRTFIASASCVVLCGAKPVFADVDRDSQNLTAQEIAKVISPKTKAIIAVHLAGRPSEMDPIRELANNYGLKIIEDCAQAQGAKYRDRHIGSLSEIAVFSFCHDKIMTTGGEGGMLTTNDAQIWEKAWSFKDHGKSYRLINNRQQGSPAFFKWLHDDFGTNWRLTEMQAAIGRVALGKVDEWVRVRRRHAEILEGHFLNLPALRVAVPPDHIYHAYYKYYVFVRQERLKPGWDRNRILLEINRRGIPCFMGICSEVYQEKAFAKTGLQPPQRLPVAKELGETAIMFLVHPTLTEEDLFLTADIVGKVVSQATN